VHNTFQSLQGLKSIYRFPGESLDVDHTGSTTRTHRSSSAPSVLDVSREASFEKKHVSNTHGSGVAISYANKVNAQGLPEFLLQGVPAESAPEFNVPFEKQQIYYGENLAGYALVGATRPRSTISTRNNQEVTVRNNDVGGVKMGLCLPPRHVRPTIRSDRPADFQLHHVRFAGCSMYAISASESKRSPRSFVGTATLTPLCPTAT
jgi:uncharacterized membrane protein (UPF0182 family)